MLYAGIGRDDFAAAFASDGFQGFSSLWWKNHIGRTKEVKELAVYGKSGKKKELLPQIENKKDESKTGGIWRLFSSEKLVSILTGSNKFRYDNRFVSTGNPMCYDALYDQNGS